jgi:hypothetical protein
LPDKAFIVIDSAQNKCLAYLVRCLERIEQQKSVPKLLLKQALNQKQFVDYIESYDFQITHAEDELTEGMPDELIDFARMVKEGDKYNALADSPSCNQLGACAVVGQPRLKYPGLFKFVAVIA